MHVFTYCNCILYFLKSTLLYLRKVLVWQILARDMYRIVPACAGVCRAYLLDHLKCTRKSKMLRSLLPVFPSHNSFSQISFFLPYRSSVLFFLSVTLSLLNSCAHCSNVERIQLLPRQTYQWILSCACLDGKFWTLLGRLLSLLLLLLLLLAQVFSMSRT